MSTSNFVEELKQRLQVALDKRDDLLIEIGELQLALKVLNGREQKTFLSAGELRKNRDEELRTQIWSALGNGNRALADELTQDLANLRAEDGGPLPQAVPQKKPRTLYPYVKKHGKTLEQMVLNIFSMVEYPLTADAVRRVLGSCGVRATYGSCSSTISRLVRKPHSELIHLGNIVSKTSRTMMLTIHKKYAKREFGEVTEENVINMITRYQSNKA